MDRVNFDEIHTTQPILQFRSRNGATSERLVTATTGRGGTGNCRELYGYTHALLGVCVRAVSVRGDVYDIPWHLVRQARQAEEAEQKPKRSRKP